MFLTTLFSDSEQTRGNPGAQSNGTERHFHRLMSAGPPEMFLWRLFFAYSRGILQQKTKMEGRRGWYVLFPDMLEVKWSTRSQNNISGGQDERKKLFLYC